MKSFLCAGCLLLITLSIGCAPAITTKKELNLSLHDVIAKVQSRSNIIQSLKANGHITVESQEGSGNVSFDVYVKKPDSVRMEFQGPFGLHLGTLALSPEQFIFYNPLENRAIIGKPDGKTLQALLRLNMHYQEIVNALTGEFSFTEMVDSLQHFYTKDENYVITYPQGNERREYYIEGELFFISGVLIRDPEGHPIMIANASRPIKTNKVVMPTLVRVVFPKERRSVTIAYDFVEINKSVRCSVTLPNHVEYIYR